MSLICTREKMTAAESLLDLSDDAFRRIVDEDIRGRSTPEIATDLRDKPVIMRWYRTLVTIRESVDLQLANAENELARARMSAETEGERIQLQLDHDSWRSKVNRFSSGLEARLFEARDRIQQYGDPSVLAVDAVIAERNQLKARVEILEQAIRTHRDSVESDPDGLEPDESDLALWALVTP